MTSCQHYTCHGISILHLNEVRIQLLPNAVKQSDLVWWESWSTTYLRMNGFFFWLTGYFMESSAGYMFFFFGGGGAGGGA